MGKSVLSSSNREPVDQSVPTPEGDAGAAEASGRTAGWIVSPWFDLLLICNLTWLAALLPVFISPEGEPYFDNFWVAYFLATPHRWMTLVLATCDPERRRGRSGLMILIAAITAIGVLAAHFGTPGGLKSLALFYSIIIAWHFASQHAGVLRMYARKAGGGWRWMETWPPRVFVFYVSLRTITGSDTLLGFWPLQDVAGSGMLLGLIPVQHIAAFDWVMLALPAMMWAVELVNRPWQRLPKVIYMMSFTAMYACMLMAVHFHERRLMMAMLAVGTVYHSVEYLAITIHYARRRQNRGEPAVFQRMARHWVPLVSWYIVVVGLVYSVGTHWLTAAAALAFYGVNVWASILHCIFDGFMWKLRDPSTAYLLDVQIPGEGGGGSESE